MGNKQVKQEEEKAQKVDEKLDQFLERTKGEANKVYKLLLLGPGESGKSTIFKQMQILFVPNPFSPGQKNWFRIMIRRNVVECIQILIDGVTKFNLSFTDRESSEKAAFLMDLDLFSADFWKDGIVPAIRHLWRKEETIAHVYERRSKLQLLDSCSYLMERLDEINQPSYTPTIDDILRARARTSAIVEQTFQIQQALFKFLDVGGQRNERRKWIHCFEDVTAIIYVAAMQEFDQVLYEDEKTNRLQESIRVFSEVVSSVYFSKPTIILFLNKRDLFEDKIKKVNLKVCFEDYLGDNSYANAAKFIEDQFRKVNKNKSRLVFTHFTCATDTDGVEKVFRATRETILYYNLKVLNLK